MSISVKDLDPAFQGLSNKPGLDVWRLDQGQVVAVPKADHGKFFTKDAYIVLKTSGSKHGGAVMYAIHYWLGKSTTQDDAAMAAIKTVDLDAALGGKAAQYRETQGHESDLLLSYFRPCIIATPGSWGHPDPEASQPRLLQVKGRRFIHVRQVAVARSSLSHSEIFVLDTRSKLFQFTGANASKQERVKGMEVMQLLQDTQYGGKAPIAIIDDGKLDDPESNEFWDMFGGFAPIAKKSQGEDDVEVKPTPPTLYSSVRPTPPTPLCAADQPPSSPPPFPPTLPVHCSVSPSPRHCSKHIRLSFTAVHASTRAALLSAPVVARALAIAPLVDVLLRCALLLCFTGCSSPCPLAHLRLCMAPVCTPLAYHVRTCICATLIPVQIKFLSLTRFSSSTLLSSLLPVSPTQPFHSTSRPLYSLPISALSSSQAASQLVSGDGLQEVGAGAVKKLQLEGNKCYLVDMGPTVFVWFGRISSLDERRAACIAAEVRLLALRAPARRGGAGGGKEGGKGEGVRGGGREREAKWGGWGTGGRTGNSEGGPGIEGGGWAILPLQLDKPRSFPPPISPRSLPTFSFLILLPLALLPSCHVLVPLPPLEPRYGGRHHTQLVVGKKPPSVRVVRAALCPSNPSFPCSPPLMPPPRAPSPPSAHQTQLVVGKKPPSVRVTQLVVGKKPPSVRVVRMPERFELPAFKACFSDWPVVPVLGGGEGGNKLKAMLKQSGVVDKAAPKGAAGGSDEHPPLAETPGDLKSSSPTSSSLTDFPPFFPFLLASPHPPPSSRLPLLTPPISYLAPLVPRPSITSFFFLLSSPFTVLPSFPLPRLSSSTPPSSPPPLLPTSRPPFLPASHPPPVPFSPPPASPPPLPLLPFSSRPAASPPPLLPASAPAPTGVEGGGEQQGGGGSGGGGEVPRGGELPGAAHVHPRPQARVPALPLDGQRHLCSNPRGKANYRLLVNTPITPIASCSHRLSSPSATIALSPPTALSSLSPSRSSLTHPPPLLSPALSPPTPSLQPGGSHGSHGAGSADHGWAQRQRHSGEHPCPPRSLMLRAALGRVRQLSQCPVRVVQGREPEQFLSLFKNHLLFLKVRCPSSLPQCLSVPSVCQYAGKAAEAYDAAGIALFRVRARDNGLILAVQMDTVPRSLNSSECMLLQTPSNPFLWVGKNSSEADKAAATTAAEIFKPGVALKQLAEGKETSVFWGHLGALYAALSSLCLPGALHPPSPFPASPLTPSPLLSPLPPLPPYLPSPLTPLALPPSVAQPGVALKQLAEGKETSVFWGHLGAKGDYPAQREQREAERDARLFHYTGTAAAAKVVEVPNYEQEDLISEDVMLLDTHSEVYVWVGVNLPDKDKKDAFEYAQVRGKTLSRNSPRPSPLHSFPALWHSPPASWHFPLPRGTVPLPLPPSLPPLSLWQRYVEQVAGSEGRSKEVTIIRVVEGFEPPMFTTHFQWDPTKTAAFVDPHERKLAHLQGREVELSDVSAIGGVGHGAWGRGGMVHGGVGHGAWGRGGMVHGGVGAWEHGGVGGVGAWGQGGAAKRKLATLGLASSHPAAAGAAAAAPADAEPATAAPPAEVVAAAAAHAAKDSASSQMAAAMAALKGSIKGVPTKPDPAAAAPAAAAPAPPATPEPAPAAEAAAPMSAASQRAAAIAALSGTLTAEKRKSEWRFLLHGAMSLPSVLDWSCGGGAAYSIPKVQSPAATARSPSSTPEPQPVASPAAVTPSSPVPAPIPEGDEPSDAAGAEAAVEGAVFALERLTVNSTDPAPGIDTKKREVRDEQE
ncbi:unnamed protein product [Closterium sp. Naga37s-1]|nr:unnamed protein product [Closterium sp. Naga37s-1]